MPSFKLFLLISSLNGLLAVTLGAFGSHGLKTKISEQMLGVWQTAVQYHFYHVFALLGVALLLQQQGITSKWLLVSGWGFGVGLLLFCGSLYWMALGGPKWLGPITPLGGLCFMIGWVSLAVTAVKLSPQ